MSSSNSCKTVPPTQPSMQTVQFCFDFPIFMFLMSLRYLCGKPLVSEQVLAFSISSESLYFKGRFTKTCQMIASSQDQSDGGQGVYISHILPTLDQPAFIMIKPPGEFQVIKQLLINAQKSIIQGLFCGFPTFLLPIIFSLYIPFQVIPNLLCYSDGLAELQQQMKKIGAQIKFNTTEETALTELKLLKKKPNKERIETVKGSIKYLQQCIENMKQTFANLRINQKDVEIKIESYKDRKRTIFKQLQRIEIDFKNKDLLQNSPTKNQELTSEEKMKFQNRVMAEKQDQQLGDIHRTLHEAGAITKNTVGALHEQMETLVRLENDAEEAEGELSMINEFMSIISNRNLITRLILVALVLFLGVVDLTVIVLKIS